MFGYVTADIQDFTPEELETYKGYYCGLCRELKKRHGNISRMALTYDMTFLIVLLSSIYETDDLTGEERCGIHPIKKHNYIINKFTEYAADMTILLTRNKFLDDWNDDRSYGAKFGAFLFENNYKKISNKYPRQCGVVESCLAELSEVEKKGILIPDVPANIFGRLLAELFIIEEDQYSNALRASMFSLGKFIYIMDAWDDLNEDIKKERYNPLTSMNSVNIVDVLSMLLGDCSSYLFTLPIKKNETILKNIIYKGVWAKYTLKMAKKIKDEEKQASDS